MYQSPYETTAFKRYNLAKVVDALKVAKANGDLQKDLLSSAPNLYVIIGKSAVTEMIPPFPMPIMLPDQYGEDVVAVDLRAFNSKLISGQSVKDPDGGAAELLVRLALLQTIWKKNGPSVVGSVGNLPAQVFSIWMANTLSRVLGLDARSRAEMITIVAWYWYCLHLSPQDYESLGESDLAKYATKVSSNSVLPFEETFEIIKASGYMAGIDDLVRVIKSMNTVKTDRVEAITLYNALSGSWYGSADSKTLVNAALEFPPIFISILVTAITEPGFRKSPIFETAKFLDKRGAFDAFRASVAGIIRAYGV